MSVEESRPFSEGVEKMLAAVLRRQPGVSLQLLRRSHGTALLASDMPVTQAAARMGHSPDVFLRIYVRDNDATARQDAMRELAEELYG